MKKFLSLVPPSALLLLAAQLLFAQDAVPPVDSTAASPASQSTFQSSPVAAPEDKLTFFSLEHRSPDQIEPADAAVLRRRHRAIVSEAEFYGYDMSAGSWKYEQSVCPFMPDYILLRYSRKNDAGAESLFTMMVPRGGGRIWTVPILTNGATRFRPAPVDARNFQVFSQVVPSDMARQNSGPDGKWLTLSVCYAEMTGARPQVPNQPSLDLHMVNAPPPTLRIDVTGRNHEVRFVDPLSQENYRLWEITYGNDGHILSVNDEQHAFVEPTVVHPTLPVPKEMPVPPAPSVNKVPHP